MRLTTYGTESAGAERVGARLRPPNGLFDGGGGGGVGGDEPRVMWRLIHATMHMRMGLQVVLVHTRVPIHVHIGVEFMCLITTIWYLFSRPSDTKG